MKLLLLTLAYFFRNKVKELIIAPYLCVWNALLKFFKRKDWHKEFQELVWSLVGIFLFIGLLVALVFATDGNGKWESTPGIVFKINIWIEVILIFLSGLTAFIYHWVNGWNKKFFVYLKKNWKEVSFGLGFIALSAGLAIGGYNYNYKSKPYEVEKVRIVGERVLGVKYQQPWKIVSWDAGNWKDRVHINKLGQIYLMTRQGLDGAIASNYYSHFDWKFGEVETIGTVHEEIQDGIIWNKEEVIHYTETITPEDHKIRNMFVGGLIPTALFIMQFILQLICPRLYRFIKSNWEEASKEAKNKLNGGKK